MTFRAKGIIFSNSLNSCIDARYGEREKETKGERDREKGIERDRKRNKETRRSRDQLVP